jgi:hypothetical protein
MSNFNRGPSKDASYNILIHLTLLFQRKRLFLEINESETKFACGSHVLWKFLYKDCSFRHDPLTNMATTGDSCF